MAPRAALASGGQQRRRLVAGVAAAACLLAATVAYHTLRGQPSSAATTKYGLRQPEERRSARGRLATRLRVVAARDAFGVVARRYEGATPGPTLRARPGDVVSVTVENRLGPEDRSAFAEDALHSPNTTTLHAHGLHVSPTEDDVFTLVAPGAARTYESPPRAGAGRSLRERARGRSRAGTACRRRTRGARSGTTRTRAGRRASRSSACTARS